MPTHQLKIFPVWLSAIFLFTPLLALADYTLLEPTIVGQTGTAVTSPGLATYLVWLFNAFFAFIAIATFIQIILSGVSYVTSAIPQVKVVAKNKMGQALFGLALALGAWLILNTISPNTFTTINLNLQNVTTSGPAGGNTTPTNNPINNAVPADGSTLNPDGSRTSATTAEACAELDGIMVTSSNGSGPCPGRDNYGAGSLTSLDGIQPTTIAGAQRMHQNCPSCTFVITGATDGGNCADGYCHNNGYKLDFDDNNSTDAYFLDTSRFVRDGNRLRDNAPLYRSLDGTILAADERAPGMGTGPHWDVTFYPK